MALALKEVNALLQRVQDELRVPMQEAAAGSKTKGTKKSNGSGKAGVAAANALIGQPPAPIAPTVPVQQAQVAPAAQAAAPVVPAAAPVPQAPTQIHVHTAPHPAVPVANVAPVMPAAPAPVVPAAPVPQAAAATTPPAAPAQPTAQAPQGTPGAAPGVTLTPSQALAFQQWQAQTRQQPQAPAAPAAPATPQAPAQPAAPAAGNGGYTRDADGDLIPTTGPASPSGSRVRDIAGQLGRVLKQSAVTAGGRIARTNIPGTKNIGLIKRDQAERLGQQLTDLGITGTGAVLKGAGKAAAWAGNKAYQGVKGAVQGYKSQKAAQAAQGALQAPQAAQTQPAAPAAPAQAQAPSGGTPAGTGAQAPVQAPQAPVVAAAPAAANPSLAHRVGQTLGSQAAKGANKIQKAGAASPSAPAAPAATPSKVAQGAMGLAQKNAKPLNGGAGQNAPRVSAVSRGVPGQNAQGTTTTQPTMGSRLRQAGGNLRQMGASGVRQVAADFRQLGQNIRGGAAKVGGRIVNDVSAAKNKVAGAVQGYRDDRADSAFQKDYQKGVAADAKFKGAMNSPAANQAATRTKAVAGLPTGGQSRASSIRAAAGGIRTHLSGLQKHLSGLQDKIKAAHQGYQDRRADSKFDSAMAKTQHADDSFDKAMAQHTARAGTASGRIQNAMTAAKEKSSQFKQDLAGDAAAAAKAQGRAIPSKLGKYASNAVQQTGKFLKGVGQGGQDTLRPRGFGTSLRAKVGNAISNLNRSAGARQDSTRTPMEPAAVTHQKNYRMGGIV